MLEVLSIVPDTKHVVNVIAVSFIVVLVLGFIFSALLKYNWHITLHKFKVYDMMVWYMYKLLNDYHI